LNRIGHSQQIAQISLRTALTAVGGGAKAAALWLAPEPVRFQPEIIAFASERVRQPPIRKIGLPDTENCTPDKHLAHDIVRLAGLPRSTSRASITAAFGWFGDLSSGFYSDI